MLVEYYLKNQSKITRKNQIHKKNRKKNFYLRIERDYLNSVCYQVCAWNMNKKEKEKVKVRM